MATLPQSLFSSSILKNIDPDGNVNLIDSTSTQLQYWPFTLFRLDALLGNYQQFENGKGNGTQQFAPFAVAIGEMNLNGTQYWYFKIVGYSSNWISCGDILVPGITGIDTSPAGPNLVSGSNQYEQLKSNSVVTNTWVLYVDQATIVPANVPSFPNIKFNLEYSAQNVNPADANNTILSVNSNTVAQPSGATFMGSYLNESENGAPNYTGLSSISNQYIANITSTTTAESRKIPAKLFISTTGVAYFVIFTSPYGHFVMVDASSDYSATPYYDIIPYTTAGYCCNNSFTGNANLPPGSQSIYCTGFTGSVGNSYTQSCLTYFNSLCGGSSSPPVSSLVLTNGMPFTPCQSFCRTGVQSSCDTWAKTFVTALGDTAALMPVWQPLAACFMSDTFQTNYRNSLIAAVPSQYANLISQDAYCIYQPCGKSTVQVSTSRPSVPVLHPYQYNNGQTCPSLVICTETVTVNNNGTINGSVNVAQTIDQCGSTTNPPPSNDPNNNNFFMDLLANIDPTLLAIIGASTVGGILVIYILVKLIRRRPKPPPVFIRQ